MWDVCRVTRVGGQKRRGMVGSGSEAGRRSIVAQGGTGWRRGGRVRTRTVDVPGLARSRTGSRHALMLFHVSSVGVVAH
jgi:hypothetical protein